MESVFSKWHILKLETTNILKRKIVYLEFSHLFQPLSCTSQFCQFLLFLQFKFL